MTTVNVCKPIARVVREVADKTTGEPPDAITLGSVVFVFTKPEGAEYARLMRHEAVHVDQAARFAPWWTKALPQAVRAWIGTPKYLSAYYDEYRAVGYFASKFEVEARAAE